MKHKTVVYQNVEVALTELNAKDKGHYFVCSCPECDRPEAYIYKNNLNFIQCNRESQCGERMILEYHETAGELPSNGRKSATYPTLNNEQNEALDWVTRVLDHGKNVLKSKTLDSGYRGLSKELCRQSIIDLQSEKVVESLFKKTESLLGAKHYQSDWMCKRNLIFPLLGEDGSIDRILMRSSLDPDLDPKEIQLIMNPSKNTRDFFVDIPHDSETIVITESRIDGLSFKEIDPKLGLISLTGAAKTRKVQEYLQANKEILRNKNILIAMDDDLAGWKACEKVIETLEEYDIGNDWNLFKYEKGITDPNELLVTNRQIFVENYQASISNFKGIQNQKNIQSQPERA